MVRRGATSIWERWNGDTGDVAMNFFHHYALAAVRGFLSRRVAGIAFSLRPAPNGKHLRDGNPVGPETALAVDYCCAGN